MDRRGALGWDALAILVLVASGCSVALGLKSSCAVELAEVASFQTQHCAEFDSTLSKTNKVLFFTANLWNGVSGGMGSYSHAYELSEKEDGTLNMQMLDHIKTHGGQSVIALPADDKGRQTILVANYAGCGGKDKDLHVKQDCLRTQVLHEEGSKFYHHQALETYGAMEMRYLQAGGKTWFVIAENFLDQVSMWMMNPETRKIERAKRARTEGRHIVSTDIAIIHSGIYLASAAYQETKNEDFNSKSSIWKIQNGTLIRIQDINTQGAHGIRFKQYKGQAFMFISQERSAETSKISSVLYKFDKSTGLFDKAQEIPTDGAKNAEFFESHGSLFLAIACYGDIKEDRLETKSKLLSLNEATGQFEPALEVDTIGAANWEHFAIGEKEYLAVCNQGHIFSKKDMPESKIYRFNVKCDPKTEL
mmetsp:Transcript_16115/g.39231  ORF Transcript_16115/g.39231 Transcript_16115/m.39231 type:complete len:420 (-) Transcript_16115:230-1489(-)